MKTGHVLHSSPNSVNITKQSIFVALFGCLQRSAVQGATQVGTRMQGFWDTTLVGAKQCGKGTYWALISEHRTSDNINFQRCPYFAFVHHFLF